MAWSKLSRLTHTGCGPIGPKLAAIYRRHKGFCFYCGVATDLHGERRFVPTIEHRIPLARGGGNLGANKVLSCYRCNSEKGLMTESEYRVACAAAEGLSGPKRKGVLVKALRAAVQVRDEEHRRRRALRAPSGDAGSGVGLTGEGP